MSDNNKQAMPFFARYLEGQFCEDLSVEEMNEVQGGLKLAAPTPKHPPESFDGIVTTRKFPSDQEEDGGNHPITVITKKHPSEELQFDPKPRPFVTNAYPSDREGPGGY
ncbi:MAG: microviridin/marinostatin family tricyclic proteinase inhibitor [Heteroscytonema crispum UTEX LB 1556]